MLLSRDNRTRFAIFLSGLLAVLLTLGVVAPSHAAPVETPAGSGHEWPHEFKGHERGPESWFGMFSVGMRLHAPGGAAQPSVLTEAGTDKPSLPLPVPAAIWMFGTGLAALGLARRRISAWRRRDQRRATTTSTTKPERRRMSRRRLRAALRERIDCKGGGQCGEGANSSGAGQPGSNGIGGPADVPPQPKCLANPMAQRFAELAAALAEQPDVVPGRRFGMSCVKFGKRPFLALDDGERGGIAFRVGEYGAVRMLAELPQLEYWNPKQERQPKRSWVICRHGYGEVLVRLALEAYEQALRDSARAADEPREYPAAEPEGA